MEVNDHNLFQVTITIKNKAKHVRAFYQKINFHILNEFVDSVYELLRYSIKVLNTLIMVR